MNKQRRPPGMMTNPYLKKPSTKTAAASVAAVAAVAAASRPPAPIQRTKSGANATIKNVPRASSSASPKAAINRVRKVGNNGKEGSGAAAMTTPRANKAARTSNPYQNRVGGTNSKATAVTPTPKKKPRPQQNQQQRAVSSKQVTNVIAAGQSSSSKAKDVSYARKLTKPKSAQAQGQNVITVQNRPTGVSGMKLKQPTAKPMPVRKQQQQRQPTKTLKSQLKSQIAALARQKRQFLQQKELEKQKLLQQKERERLAKLQAEELKRQAKSRELARIKREEDTRKAAVGNCINTLIRGVETRMTLEETNGGTHFAIVESVQSIIGTIESKELRRQKRLENKLKREEIARRNNEAEQVTMMRKLLAMAGNNAQGSIVPSYAMPQPTQPFQMHPNHQMNATGQYQQQQQQRVNSAYGMQPHQHQSMNMIGYNPMQQPQSMVPSAAYLPHATAPNPPMNQPRTNQYNMPQSIMQPIQSIVATQSTTKPSNPVAAQSTITKPPATYQSTTNSLSAAPLVLHSSPVTDEHSPYLKSHHMHSIPICLTKKTPTDSFGVTLRWECKSAMVPMSQTEHEAYWKRVNNSWRETISPARSDANFPLPMAMVESALEPLAVPKKRKKKQADYGVMTVANASRATFANGHVARLHPGDIILSISGMSVGGLTFTEACRVIGSRSNMCSETGVVQCVLRVARRNVPSVSSVVPNALLMHQPGKAVGMPSHSSVGVQSLVPLNNTNLSVMPTPALPMIPFHASGNKVTSGELSTLEWSAFVLGLSQIPHELFSGMALISVSQNEVLDAILKSDKYGKILQRRSKETLEAKLIHASEQTELIMTVEETGHWEGKWNNERFRSREDMENENNCLFDGPLTDAHRSTLRMAARPAKGCKCGSLTHSFVNDPMCPLYRDVRQFCEDNRITIQEDKTGVTTKKADLLSKSKGKNAMEKAYIDRFQKQRAEKASVEEEAAFVLKMEKIQSSKLNKAVFAPISLCTLVLTAVASVMDLVPEDGPQVALVQSGLDREKNALGNDASKKKESKADSGLTENDASATNQNKQSHDSDSDDSDDDSDDDDLPLNSLLQSTSSKRAAAIETNSPPSKRHKPTTKTPTAENRERKAAVPSPYFLAEILKHISTTHGHLFQEPCHSEFAWQQRHRSTLSTPLPKEVMFKGNPRTPESLSFEKVHVMLNEERIARLRDAWKNPQQMQLSPSNSQPNKNATESWKDDEWIVAHLSSDDTTGLRHEINILVTMGILSVEANGKVMLAEGWQRRVPHMILNEMKDEWSSWVDVHNLFCIHDGIKLTIESQWEKMEDGWRSSRNNDMTDGYDGHALDDEEYQLRKQIFSENFTNWVSEKSGMGEFGV